MTAPAERLIGVDLPEGWKVLQRVAGAPGATGGHFSHGYIIESPQGNRAFLKALDYSDAPSSPDPALALQAMTSAYIFERDLLRQCGQRRLDRVVQAIGDGLVTVDPSNPAGVV